MRVLAGVREWWTVVLSDARVAVRGYRRTPGFTIVVLLTLALGIGPNTALFSIVDAVLLHPLPYPHPEQLVNVWETNSGSVTDRSAASYPDFEDWRSNRDLFSAVEGYDETNITVSDASGGEMVDGARVTSGFLPMLGGMAAVGRLLDESDDISGGSNTVILSYDFWTRRFAGRPDIVGQLLRIDGTPFVVRGVLSKQFHFGPAGDPKVWLPLGRDDETRSHRFDHWVNVVARLHDGVSVDRARRRMRDIMATLAARYPETNGGRSAAVAPLRNEIVEGVERPLVIIFGGVGLVLLIACANVASLVLARSAERGREIAVRSAVGASRARLIRQLVTENLILATAGGFLGIVAAIAGVRLLVAPIPRAMLVQAPALRDVSVNVSALVFTLLIAAGVGFAAGLIPAILTTRRPAVDVLRSDARVGAGRASQRMRAMLVEAELALTIVLLVGAVLLGRSVRALLHVDPGFVSEGVATARVALSGPRYASHVAQTRFFEQALTAIQNVSTAQAVGAVSSPPLGGGGTNTFRIDGEAEPTPGAQPEATARAIAGDYFRALRIPLLDGRTVDRHDDMSAPYAVVVNATLARRFFPHERAIGRAIRITGWQDRPWTIVGIVGDVKTRRLDAPAPPTIYYYHLQGPANRMSIFVRTRGAPETIIPVIRRTIRALDPGLPIYAEATMVEQVAQSSAVSARRYPLTLLAAFAVLAFALAVVGVYGVVSYSVTQRTREIGIRIALGARDRDVIRLIIGSGLRLVLIGTLVGVAAASMVSRSLSSLLFGVGANDVLSYGAVAALLACVALAASYIPARRAVRFDPATVFRAE